MREYYSRRGGSVVSFAIDKYVHVCLNKKFDGTTRVSYSQTENVNDVSELKHDLIRETLKSFKLNGLEIATISDIPGAGTGLGSSSAVTVGLLCAIARKFQKKSLSPSMLAEEAYAIEHDSCKHPVGKQDQYAVALGGMNFLRFNPSGTVTVEKIVLSPQQRKRFDDNLLLLWTGKSRGANEILSAQSKNLGKVDIAKRMQKMVDLAEAMRSDMQGGYFGDIGSYLDQGWALKRTMADGISDGELDGIYQAGKDAGADGGKLCGAGGGGFFLFWAKPHTHKDIVAATKLKKVDVHIEFSGSQVIYEQS